MTAGYLKKKKKGSFGIMFKTHTHIHTLVKYFSLLATTYLKITKKTLSSDSNIMSKVGLPN